MDQVPSSSAASCSNCKAAMQATDKWCPACGQKAYTGPPGFWHLLGHFFEAVFSLDNRFFRTLLSLAVPGRLTNNFLAGKQKPYFHPLRLFFVTGVLMIAAYSLFTAQAVGDEIDNEQENRKALAYQHRFSTKLHRGADSIKASFSLTPVAVQATDSLLSLLGHATLPEPDYNYIGFMEHQGGLRFQNRQVHVLLDDMQTLSLDSLANKHNIKGTLNRYQFRQIVRANRIDSAVVVAMISQAIWGFILLVPLIAGVLKLLYIRRKRRYVEHFIFSLHIHAFVFIVLGISALVLLLQPPLLFMAFSGLTISIYFLFALKRVYRQSWWKTLAKAVILSWSYFILFTFTMSIATVIAVAVF